MNATLKELFEKRGGLITQQTDLAAVAATEKRQLSGEELVKFEKIEADLKELDRNIEAQKTLEERAKRGADPVDPKPDAEQEHRAAFENFIKYGKESLSDDELRVLQMPVKGEKRGTSISKTTADGGATVPTGFVNQLEKALLAYGGIMSVAKIIRTNSGETLPYPYVNDTAQGMRLIAELGTVNTNATAPTFGVKNYGAYKYGTDFIPISREIMEDSAFNIYNEMVTMFAERIYRSMSTILTTADGSSKPAGVLTGATNSGINLAASTVTRTALVSLIHSVDSMYRSNAKLMFNDATLLKIKLLVDDVDRPLYQVSPIVGGADTIEGQQFVINHGMPTVGVDTKSILFGDFSKFIVRMVNDIRIVRSDELFATVDAVGLGAFVRFDSGVLDAGTHPIKYIMNAHT